MKLLNEQPSQYLRGELDLFSLIPTHTAVDGSQCGDHSTVSTITSSSPIEFIMSGSGEDYMDLNNTLLEVKAHIKTTNDSPVDASVAVVPINNTLHSLRSPLTHIEHTYVYCFSHAFHPSRHQERQTQVVIP